MFSLSFGLVDLIVAGTRFRADSVEEIGGTVRPVVVGPAHRMNHMAGWATSVHFAVSGGVGDSLLLVVERERGVLPVM